MGREVLCPACGALVEGCDDEELVRRAQLHALDAHAYKLPPEHVLADAYDVVDDEEEKP